MEKVRPWCGQPSDRGRLKIRSDRSVIGDARISLKHCVGQVEESCHANHQTSWIVLDEHLLEQRLVTDRRTNRQTQRCSQYSASIALRGKTVRFVVRNIIYVGQ